MADNNAIDNAVDVRAFRKEKRAEYLARREAVDKAQHHEWTQAVTRHLEAGFAFLAGLTVSFTWPFKNEPDSRFFIRTLRERGSRVALPNVPGKGQPLQFFEWWPGVKMQPAVYDIPVPQGTERLIPQAMLIPPIAFDAQGYRLGYGGAFFDRTAASLDNRPIKIGVGFELERIPTIYPQSWDIPMDFIVTEAGIYVARPAGLVLLPAAEVEGQVAGRVAAFRAENAAQAR